jgi:hypothetical protein
VFNAKTECGKNDFNNRFDDNKNNKIYDDKRKNMYYKIYE